MKRIDTERLLQRYIILLSGVFMVLLGAVAYLVVTMREIQISSSYTEGHASYICDQVAEYPYNHRCSRPLGSHESSEPKKFWEIWK